MTPTPQQIRQAAINILQPRTHGAKLRDALLHGKNSQAIKTPGGHPGVGVPLSGTTVTGTGKLYG